MRRQVKTLVERVLEEFPETRSSDRELIIQILQAKGASFTEHQTDLIRSLSFEGITRSRRGFQEKGLYPATAQVQAERKRKSFAVRQAIPSAQPEEVESLIAPSQGTLVAYTRKEQKRLQHIYPSLDIVFVDDIDNNNVIENTKLW